MLLVILNNIITEACSCSDYVWVCDPANMIAFSILNSSILSIPSKVSSLSTYLMEYIMDRVIFMGLTQADDIPFLNTAYKPPLFFLLISESN